MARSLGDPIQRLMSLMFKAHPWHGVSIGEKAPEVVTAYIPQSRPPPTVLQLLSGLLRSRAPNVLRREGGGDFLQAGETERHGR